MRHRVFQCSFLILISATFAMAGQTGGAARPSPAELAKQVDQIIRTAPAPSAPADFVQELDRIAQTASVMVDGDLCKKIGTSPYHIDQDAFIRVKKTLIRLSRLISYPCDVNLWMPVEDQPGMVQAVIRNENDLSQFWVFGVKPQKMFSQMEQVLKTGKQLTVNQRRPGMISVLAPVYDSLGDVVGLVEVASKEKFNCRCSPGE